MALMLGRRGHLLLRDLHGQMSGMSIVVWIPTVTTVTTA
jgi:hypothetical protein